MPSHTSIAKDPLIRAASLELYRRNVFRITGLPVDATARQITKRADELKLAGALNHGSDSRKNALSIRPEPDSEQIQEALQRLKEPELRLIDEYFWFWPLDDAGSENDPAIKALATGEIPDALQVWQDKENDPKSGPNATHNLAVFDHMVAIDWTLIQLADPTNADAASRAERYWAQAMDRWERVATDDSSWDWIKNRIRIIKDPRLTTGFARRMEAALPEAMDKINAEAALRFAECGDIDAARMHIRVMNQTHQGLDDVVSTSELVLMPMRRRVEQRIANAQKAAEADAKSAVAIAQRLLNECIPMMPLFELFHGDSHHKTELFDEVADTANRLGVIYQKATDRNNGLIELLSHAMTCASASDLKSRIRENIRLIEGNLQFEKILPVIEAIKDINGSDANPAERLAKMERKIIPMAAPLAKEAIGDKTVADMVAAALRNISIDAYNNADDTATALKSICMAQDHVKDDVLRQQIKKDRGVVEERMKRSLCVHCGERLGDPRNKHEISMYGDVHTDFSMGRFGQIHYRAGKISVPRCRVCARIQNKAKSDAVKFCLMTIVCGIAVGVITQRSIGVWVVMISVIIASVVYVVIEKPYTAAQKKLLTHPNIRDLRKKGWELGEGPNRN